MVLGISASNESSVKVNQSPIININKTLIQDDFLPPSDPKVVLINGIQLIHKVLG